MVLFYFADDAEIKEFIQNIPAFTQKILNIHEGTVREQWILTLELIKKSSLT
jgi:hypothetical protein